MLRTTLLLSISISSLACQAEPEPLLHVTQRFHRPQFQLHSELSEADRSEPGRLSFLLTHSSEEAVQLQIEQRSCDCIGLQVDGVDWPLDRVVQVTSDQPTIVDVTIQPLRSPGDYSWSVKLFARQGETEESIELGHQSFVVADIEVSPSPAYLRLGIQNTSESQIHVRARQQELVVSPPQPTSVPDGLGVQVIPTDEARYDRERGWWESTWTVQVRCEDPDSFIEGHQHVPVDFMRFDGTHKAHAASLIVHVEKPGQNAGLVGVR